MRIAFLLALAFLLSGCPEKYSTEVCQYGDENDLKIQITDGNVVSVPLNGDLIVHGLISRPEKGLSIYRAWIAGVEVSDKGFDYSQFTVTIPRAKLLSLLPANPSTFPAVAKIDADVLTNCSLIPFHVESLFEIPIETSKISRLELSIDYGFQADYVPTTDAHKVFLKLVANPEARNLPVSLVASNGTFEGVTGGSIVLGGDGIADSTALASFSTTHDATLFASSGAISAAASVRALQAPGLLPSAASLTPGSSLSTSLTDDRSGVICQSSYAQHLLVTSGPDDLMTMAGGVDTTGDGRIDIVVEALASAASEETAIVTCLDIYGQQTTAIFKVTP